MILCYVWSDNMRELKDRFEQNIQDCDLFEVHSQRITLKTEVHEFGSESWLEAVQSKVSYTREIVDRFKEQIILLSDIDVQFFDAARLLTEAKKRMEESKLHLWAMQEHSSAEINTGVIFLRSTEAIRSFYAEVDEFLKIYSQAGKWKRKWMAFRLNSTSHLKYGDQSVINAMLLKAKFKWGQISSELGCWGDADILQSHLFHHAVCTKNQEEKIQLLDKKFKEYKDKYQYAR